jgi:phosphohistidine phosphatase
MVVMSDADATRLVVLVRHAKAESGEEGADHDRRLTDRGERNAAEAGRWLAGVVPRVGAVWCSSATRAVQTWAAMGESLDAPPATVERALYLADAREIAERLDSAASQSGSWPVAVVGHNPTMEHLQALLTGELRGMRPGAVAVVDLAGRALVDSWSPA